MYSYEDRLRAVQLYIKLGKRLGLTIRQLGYPTKNALKTWYGEYEQRLELPAGYARPPRYSQAHKERAVEHHRDHGHCIAATIKALGYPSRSLLSAWIHELNPQARAPAVGRSQELAPAAKQAAVIALCMRPASAKAVAEDLGVSRGSLYKWKNQLLGHDATTPMARQEVADKYAEVRQTMACIFESNYRCYGYRRIHACLSDQSVNISEKVVRRLMKQERLVAATNKRRRYGSYMGEISPAPDNLLNRDFNAFAPNEKWLTDITEFQIPAGKVYLSPMIDCFDGMVVSWSIGTRPNAELVNTMLDAAIDKIAVSGERPLVHSDRGGHYRWPGWLARIADAKLVRSMSRKGCSPDNAACEGFFGRLKTEMFFSRDWLSTTIEEFVAHLDTYIRWYNESRIKSSLGFRSPAEHRTSLGIAV